MAAGLEGLIFMRCAGLWGKKTNHCPLEAIRGSQVERIITTWPPLMLGIIQAALACSSLGARRMR